MSTPDEQLPEHNKLPTRNDLTKRVSRMMFTIRSRMAEMSTNLGVPSKSKVKNENLSHSISGFLDAVEMRYETNQQVLENVHAYASKIKDEVFLSVHSNDPLAKLCFALLEELSSPVEALFSPEKDLDAYFLNLFKIVFVSSRNTTSELLSDPVVRRLRSGELNSFSVQGTSTAEKIVLKAFKDALLRYVSEFYKTSNDHQPSTTMRLEGSENYRSAEVLVDFFEEYGHAPFSNMQDFFGHPDEAGTYRKMLPGDVSLLHLFDTKSFLLALMDFPEGIESANGVPNPTLIDCVHILPDRRAEIKFFDVEHVLRVPRTREKVVDCKAAALKDTVFWRPLGSAQFYKDMMQYDPNLSDLEPRPVVDQHQLLMYAIRLIDAFIASEGIEEVLKSLFPDLSTSIFFKNADDDKHVLDQRFKKLYFAIEHSFKDKLLVQFMKAFTGALLSFSKDDWSASAKNNPKKSNFECIKAIAERAISARNHVKEKRLDDYRHAIDEYVESWGVLESSYSKLAFPGSSEMSRCVRRLEGWREQYQILVRELSFFSLSKAGISKDSLDPVRFSCFEEMVYFCKERVYSDDANLSSYFLATVDNSNAIELYYVPELQRKA